MSGVTGEEQAAMQDEAQVTEATAAALETEAQDQEEQGESEDATNTPALETMRVEILAECSVQIGKGDGTVETVTYEAGLVADIPADQARLFVGNGRAVLTKKKPRKA